MKQSSGNKRKTNGLNLLETEEAIYHIKQNFQRNLADALSLYRVSSPLFVASDSGMQDNLNGKERPVAFNVAAIGMDTYEVVHSLAKWKRYALARYRVPTGKGVYTDMNAIRPDEETLSSRIHSVYVDQWDWEKNMTPGNRNLGYLKDTVKEIYKVLLNMETEICSRYEMEPVLPAEIRFVHTEDLALAYPSMTPKEREHMVCREWGAVFLIGIGGPLPNGSIHDGRAPDYDDWSSPTDPLHNGLNGDILVWNPVLNQSLELSSMGIRVDKATLIRQLKIRDCTDRLRFPWHQMLLSNELPQSIGGGIGQSRLCMFLLRKSHIGEVQSGVWPKDVIKSCKSEGLHLL